jgi:hypothetical protein
LTDISARMSFERNQAREEKFERQRPKQKAPPRAAPKAQAPKYRPAPKRGSSDYGYKHAYAKQSGDTTSKAKDESKSKYGKENKNPQGAAPHNRNFNPGSKAAPNKPHVTARTQDSITIEWDMMESAVAYQLQWRLRGGQWAVAGKFLKSNTVRKRNLSPDTWYEFRIQAVNKKGPPWCTDYSSILLTRTTMQSTTGTPPAKHRPAPPAHGRAGSANPARESLNRRQGREAKNAKDRMRERGRQKEAEDEAAYQAKVKKKKDARAAADSMKDSWAWKRDAKKRNKGADKSTRKWTCDVCQRQNRMRHTCCKVCSAPRGYDASNLDGISGEKKKKREQKKGYKNPFKREKKETECEFGWGPDDNVWQELLDENQHVYYYNPSTGISKWEPPMWTAHEDPESGATYYQNNETGESQWTAPASFVPIVRSSS